MAELAHNRQPAYRISADTNTLIRILKTAEVGDTIDYERLTAAIGRNVREQGRGALDSARKIVQRENGFVFDVVPTVGIKRLSDQEIVKTSDRGRQHINRTARKTAATLTCVRDYSALPQDLQTKHNAELSILGAIAHASSAKQAERIEQAIGNNGQQVLSLDKTLEHFKKL